MGAIGLAVAVLAVLGAAVLVLRDVAAFGRPAVPAPEVPALADPAPPLTVAPVLGVARLPVAEPVAEAVVTAPPAVAAPPTPVVVRSEPVRPYDTHDSVLAALAQTEHDERSPLRRVGALVVLLTLTLVTAALVGAGIYQAVSKFG